MEIRTNRLAELAGERRTFLWVVAAIALTAAMAASLIGCGQASQSNASSSAASASASSTASSAASASTSSNATGVTAAIPDGAIEWTEASAHVGETVSVYGPVKGSSYLSDSEEKHTCIDIGTEYPDEHRVNMDIEDKNRDNFPGDPESIYLGKTVCVTGEIYEHDGIPYIKVASADQVKVLD
jgi:hypothetical protein